MSTRLETMVAMSSLNLPEHAMRRQIASAIDLVIQCSRLSDGTRKVVSIAELTGMEGDIVTMQDIFVFEKQGIDVRGRVVGRFKATGVVPKFLEKLKTSGIAPSPNVFEHSFEIS